MEYKSATEMYNKELPEYLYHYTSLETLSLILESNKIRLNRLDKVNDLQEARKTVLGDLKLLKALDIVLPKSILHLGVKVATKEKLPERRQLSKQ